MTKKTDLQTTNNPSNVLARYLDDRIKPLREWCEGRVNPETLIRFARADFAKSPGLQKCTPQSIYLALIACAQVGLEPGGVMQHAFIIPYGKEATFQLGYRGVIELANRSPLIARVGMNLVYEAEIDDIDIDLGSDAHVVHRPVFRERGALAGAYAFAKYTTGEIDVEWCDLADLKKIRDAGQNGPAWKTWEDQMYRKAPMKRLAKRLPLSSEAARAFRLDSQAEGGDRAAYIETLEDSGVIVEDDDSNAPPKSGTDKLKAELK